MFVLLWIFGAIGLFSVNADQESSVTRNAASFLQKENERMRDECWGKETESQEREEFNISSFAWKNFTDPNLKRAFQLYSNQHPEMLPEDELYQLAYAMGGMRSNYRKNICSFRVEDNDLICNETASMSENGRKMRSHFLINVELQNKLSRMNGYSDLREWWQSFYDLQDFENNVESLFSQILPFYKNLHAYVRSRLKREYGNKIKQNGPIPIHLLRDKTSSDYWGYLEELLTPFPDKPSMQIDKNLKQNEVTVKEMAKMAENFYSSLGFPPIPEIFWNVSKFLDSSLEPCRFSRFFDGCDGNGLRLHICGEPESFYFFSTFHLIGYVQQAISSLKQYVFIQKSSNLAFRDASAEAISLSVSTPRYLFSIGFLNESQDDPERDLNFLMETALRIVPRLMDSLAVSKWRYDVLQGLIPDQEMNRKFWTYRLKYQGLCPPLQRSDDDFDPGTVFEIALNQEYIHHFLGGILQFDLHKKLCQYAEIQTPLHLCNIFGSTSAGHKFRSMLEVGNSKPWHEIISYPYGDRINATAMLEYFQPLNEWLLQQNQNQDMGWESQDPLVCP